VEEPFDPMQKVELAMLRAEHQKRFQTQIALIKAQVGEGAVYRNDVVTMVVSETGAYYELNDLPEEFGGVAGSHVEPNFLSEADAVAQLDRAHRALAQASPENTRHISVVVLYSRRGLADRKNCFVFEYRPVENAPDRPPLVIGSFRPGAMPRFFKLKVDAEYAPEALGMARGMAFCMANAGDRHLLVRAPFIGAEVHDLSGAAASGLIQ